MSRCRCPGPEELEDSEAPDGGWDEKLLIRHQACPYRRSMTPDLAANRLAVDQVAERVVRRDTGRAVSSSVPAYFVTVNE